MMMMPSYFLCLVIVCLALCGRGSLAQEMTESVEAGQTAVPEESPYYDAARIGNLNILRKELSLGHNVNIQNQDGWSPLMFAVEAYQPQAISLVRLLSINITMFY